MKIEVLNKLHRSLLPKSLIIIILLLMTNDIFSQSNKFRGLVKSEVFVLKREGYLEGEKDAIDAALNGALKKTFYINRAVCGDTIISVFLNKYDSILVKDILIGQDMYLKVNQSYSKMGAAPHPLEKIKPEAWKKVRQKELKGAYQYYAENPHNIHHKFYIDIDDRFKVETDIPLKKSFAKIYNPFGIYKKLMQIYPEEIRVVYYDYLEDSKFDCTPYMEDFILDDSEEISFKNLTLNYAYDILPENERTAIPFGELKDRNGQLFLMADLKDKLTYIDVWASWCKPCIRAIPDLAKINEKYAPKGLQVISISVDGNEEEWNASADDVGIEWTNLLLIDNFNAPFSEKLEIITIPRYILVDTQGRIINESAPPPTNPKLEEILDSLLEN